MTHADAFLRDILAHPDDDAPRLIFADWLEEQGDANCIARAEFIRVQCALAAGQLPEQQRAELEKRQQQILDEWGDEWARPIRRLVRFWKFRRGFIDGVFMSPNSFLAHANRLFRHAPIQHLHLWPREESVTESIHIAALADNEFLRHLRTLDLRWNRLESRDIRALVVSEHLTKLAVLNLSHNRIGDSGVRALASSRLLGRLEHLNLSFNDVGTNGLRTLALALEELARGPDGLRLRRLDLSHRLNAAVQRVIADSPLLRRLVRI